MFKLHEKRVFSFSFLMLVNYASGAVGQLNCGTVVVDGKGSKLDCCHAPPPPKTAELDELGQLSRQLAERSKSRRADYRLSEVESIIKSVPEPLPTRPKEHNRETMESRTSNGTSFNSSAIHREHQDRSEYVTDTSSWQFNQSPFSPRSVNSINGGRNGFGSTSAMKSEEGLLKVRTSMHQDQKQQEQQRRHSFTRLTKEPVRREIVEVRREQVVSKPKVTQTVQRFEENKRTEEVERRVIRRERRHKSHRTRYGHGYQQEYDYHNGGGGYRSTSASRGGAYNTNGYAHPITYESHHTSSRRGGGEHERSSAASDLYSQHNRGMAHARYGSLSDSLRRGELKYIPNGEVREANGQNGYSKHTKVHKSHSTRDVFGHNGGNYGSHYSFNNRHGNFEQPVVEFPPTLPRGGRYGSHLDAPVPPPHRGGGDSYRPLTKSRSYADWDQGRGPFGNSVSRYDEDMARLENEFRDSHLIRMPNGPMNEKEYRHQEIPGGYETYSRDTKANGGRKLNRDGLPTDFKESSQEYNFKREQQR